MSDSEAMSSPEFAPEVIERAAEELVRLGLVRPIEWARTDAKVALTAAFSVLDEDGIPRVLRPWLEYVGWDNPETWPVPFVRSPFVPHPERETRLFRLRVPYQEEAR